MTPDATDPLVAAAGPARLVHLLTTRGDTVATAESLTAGLLSATIAGVPGASAVLRGGLITYATDLKATLAGVDPQLLATQGPIAADTAAQMAAGAVSACDADWGIGLTGVAGPDPQDGHLPGTVFLALAHRIDGNIDSRSTSIAISGTRWQIRLGSCARAIAELVAWIESGN